MKRFLVTGLGIGVLCCSILYAGASHASGHLVLSQGSSYQIAEEDIAKLVQKRLQQLDWRKVTREMEHGLLEWHPELPQLPAATKDQVYQVDPTEYLAFDVRDGNGNIVYPQGMAINPLDYASTQRLYVVLNGDRPEELDWFAGTDYKDSLGVTVLVTAGDRNRIATRWHQNVFWLPTNLAERFQLKVTPTIVRQVGNRLELTEVKVAPRRGGKKYAK